MSLGQIIRDRREELGMTQDQVSVRVGISKPYLSNIETERAKNPPSGKVLDKLELALNFPKGKLTTLANEIWTPLDVRQKLEQLQAEVAKLRVLVQKKGHRLKEHELETPAGTLVPVINRVMAGYPHDFTDLDYPVGVANEYVRVPDVHDANAFAARVIGDSMEPDYLEGDIVVFAPNLQPRDGDDCFARFARDNSTNFKRYYADKNKRLRLEPLNAKYKPEVYDPEEITALWPALMRIFRIRRG